MTSITVIIASSGRETLQRSIESVHSQLVEGDEVLVSVNRHAKWGHAARNQLMKAARGDCIAFLDDDDIWTPNAADTIRQAFEASPRSPHLFRMSYDDGSGRPTLWQSQQVTIGNVSTGMIICPNVPEKLAEFAEDVYEGDFWFITDTLKKWGEMVWDERVITSTRPV